MSGRGSERRGLRSRPRQVLLALVKKNGAFAGQVRIQYSDDIVLRNEPVFRSGDQS